MPDDKDDAIPEGFFEAAQAFADETTRRQNIRALGNAQLISYHRALSNVTIVAPGPLLALLEEELERRGLKSVS